MNGHTGSQSKFEALEHELQRDFKIQAEISLSTLTASGNIVRAPRSLESAMAKGVELILDATLIGVDGTVAHFDALFQDPTRSSKSAFHYYPILFRYQTKVKEDDQLLLAYLGRTLAQTQRNESEVGIILHGGGCVQKKVRLLQFLEAVDSSIKTLFELSHDTPPKVRLNNHCRVCEFKSACAKEAQEKDDLSLLRGLPIKDIEHLNAKGILPCK